MENSSVLSKLRSDGVEALTELFMQHRTSLRRLIAIRLDPRLHARVDASDIVQEAYVRAGKALPSYLNSPTLHPVVWLRLIGKRLVAETHRKHFRMKRNPDQELAVNQYGDDMLVNQLADSILSVGTLLEKLETVKQIRGLLEQLPERDRDILEMRHVDAMTLHEAAQTLEIPYDTAKKRYQRALSRFRKIAEKLVADSRVKRV